MGLLVGGSREDLEDLLEVLGGFWEDLLHFQIFLLHLEERGSPVRGSVQDSFRGTFRGAFWKFFGVFSEPFGNLGGTFGRLLVNFRSFGGSF